MTTTAHRTTPITHADRIPILVDHHAELARRSARVRSWGEWRVRMFRCAAQVAFNEAWGLR